MALPGFKATAVSGSGDTIGSTQVEVRRRSDNALASLFDAATSGSALTNPFNADANGDFEFFAAADDYIVTLGSGSSPQVFPLTLINYDEADTRYARLSGASFTGNVNFGDDDKAIFGAGSDLQIYHNGNHSFIDDTGTGDLYLRGSVIRLQKYTGENLALFRSDGAVTLYHDDAAKLDTTSSGVDVTGTGLFSGRVGIGTDLGSNPSGADPDADNLVIDAGGADAGITIDTGTAAKGSLFFADGSTGDALKRGQIVYDHNGDYMAFATNAVERMRLISSGAKIGTGADGSSNGDELVLSKDQTNVGMSILCADATGIVRFYLGSQTDPTAASIRHSEINDQLFVQAKGDLYFQTGGTNTRVVIDGTGKVGIGTESPATRLHVQDADNALGTKTGTLFVEDTEASVEINSAAGGDCYVYFTDGNTNAATGGSIKYSEPGGANQHMALFVGGSETMRLDSSGNVGIGLASPTVRLHVQEDAAASVSSIIRNSNASQTSSLMSLSSVRSASASYNFLQAFSSTFGDKEFQLSGDGNGTCDGAWTGGGADYAEYFEWSDGNPDAEDRVGYSVVLDGDKIRKAAEGEEPLGVISGNPSVVGDGDIDRWKHKYLRDDFNRYVWEDYQAVSWTEHVPAVTEEQILPAVLGDEGNEIEPARTEVVEVKPAEDIPHSYAADQVPDGVTVPADAERVTQQRRKLNPAHDDALEYTPRSERAEWDTVGLMGKLRLRKGQPTGSRWVKMRDVSADVEEWLVR